MRRILIAACTLLLAACGQAPDLKQALEVTDLVTGWYDAGIVDGKNKLVPSISFRLRDKANAGIDSVSLNIVFKRADNAEEHDSIFVQSVDFADGVSETVTVRSQTGHTGEPPQTRADMLQHSGFVDMDALIFVRQSASQWVELHRARVERQLITQ